MKTEIKSILTSYSLNKEQTLEDATHQILRLFSTMNRCSACKFWKQTTSYEDSINDGVCSKLVSTDKVKINLHLGWEGGYVNDIETEEDFYCHLFERLGT